MCVPQSLAVSVTIAISLRTSYTRFMNSTVAAQSKTRPFVRRLFTWRTVLLLWKRGPSPFPRPQTLSSSSLRLFTPRTAAHNSFPATCLSPAEHEIGPLPLPFSRGSLPWNVERTGEEKGSGGMRAAIRRAEGRSID